MCGCESVHVCACVCVCVRACVRACVRVSVCHLFPVIRCPHPDFTRHTHIFCVFSGTFRSSTDVQSKSVQLVCCLNLLLSHNALWTAAFTRVTSTLITDLCGRMASTVRKLGHHMALLLQVRPGDLSVSCPGHPYYISHQNCTNGNLYVIHVQSNNW